VASSPRDREILAGPVCIRTEGRNSRRVLALSGELDLSNADRFSDELARAEDGASPPSRIVLDLSELEFIDSTGIAILVAAHRRLNGDDVRLQLVRSRSAAVRRVFSLTGLDDSIPFVDS
jgi:anti-anti-sigma factor